MPEIEPGIVPYRESSEIPEFDDSKPLFIFDGECVMCSTGARLLMNLDKSGRVNLTSTQSTVGNALCDHYKVDPNESYLLLMNGRAYTASRGYLELAGFFGGVWNIFRIAAIVPETWRDRLYGAIARSRYKFFGKAEYCTLLTDEQRARLL